MNRYERKMYSKKKRSRLLNSSYYPVYKKEDNITSLPYVKQYYRSRDSALFKRMSNKVIRKSKISLPPKGNVCHKLFDYWWNIY